MQEPGSKVAPYPCYRLCAYRGARLAYARPVHDTGCAHGPPASMHGQPTAMAATMLRSRQSSARRLPRPLPCHARVNARRVNDAGRCHAAPAPPRESRCVAPGGGVGSLEGGGDRYMLGRTNVIALREPRVGSLPITRVIAPVTKLCYSFVIRVQLACWQPISPFLKGPTAQVAAYRFSSR